MTTLALMFIHKATVSPFTGSTSTGDGYGDPKTVNGFLDDGVVLEQSAAGEQLVSRTKFYTSLDNAALFVPESLVACNGRNMQVTQTHRRDGGTLLGDVSHLEVDLG